MTRRTGKEGLYQRIVPIKRRQDEESPVLEYWGRCDDCRPEFPCYDEPGCLSELKDAEETKWDST